MKQPRSFILLAAAGLLAAGVASAQPVTIKSYNTEPIQVFNKAFEPVATVATSALPPPGTPILGAEYGMIILNIDGQERYIDATAVSLSNVTGVELPVCSKIHEVAVENNAQQRGQMGLGNGTLCRPEGGH